MVKCGLCGDAIWVYVVIMLSGSNFMISTFMWYRYFSILYSWFLNLAVCIEAMGNLRNCGLRNAEGNLRNVICGATVIGQRVRSRDCSYSSVYHWPCIDSGEVKCIMHMRKMTRTQRVGLIYICKQSVDFLLFFFYKNKFIKVRCACHIPCCPLCLACL